MTRALFPALPLAMALTVSAAHSTGSALAQAADVIRPEALRAHIAFLSDDALEGRGTGTRGYEVAALYMAAQMEAAGLQPGAAGSWLQRVPLRRAELVSEGSGMEIIGRDLSRMPLKLYDDIMLPADLRGTTDIEAPVVFAGYGVTAPEQGHDDYAEIDARGKIVALFADAPASFSPAVRAFYASNTEKSRNAAAHGAVGLLRLRTPADERTASWARVTSTGRGVPAFAWLEGGEPHDFRPELKGTAVLGPKASESLFDGAPMTFAEAVASRKPSALAVRVRIFKQGNVKDLTSPNVVGLLRGSDPVLRDEYVVYTAHLDHIGIGTPVAGDAIYNGAADDASGCSALIELGRAFASLPRRPRRSILFVAVTGEESGLLGSSYFVHHPPVPIDSIVANLNIDGMTFFPFTALVARGAEHSSILRAVDAAASRLAVPTAPDPTPEQVYFVRSDQYSFVKRGIPALFLGTIKTEAAQPLALAYQRERYHRPSDDMTQPMDMEAAARFARAYFLIGQEIAAADERPRWNPGDFFGERFGTSHTRAR